MNLLDILILAVVQGAAELLPVSSSAHVIMAEKLMGLDPTAPEMTFLLVMLHTGTMFAVIAHYAKAWKESFFASAAGFRTNAMHVVIATAMTGVVGLTLMQAIKWSVAKQMPEFEIEHLFGNARLMAAALACAGLVIVLSAWLARRDTGRDVSTRSALWIGAVQGLCLPFRGFSRSGATISTGLASGVGRLRAEQFSFALAVVITPAVIVREAWRLFKGPAALDVHHSVLQMLTPGLIGMAMSFVAGLLALRWLSRWLAEGRWAFFGVYCFLAAGVVLVIG